MNRAQPWQTSTSVEVTRTATPHSWEWICKATCLLRQYIEAHKGNALHYPQIAPLHLVTNHSNSHSAAVRGGQREMTSMPTAQLQDKQGSPEKPSLSFFFPSSAMAQILGLVWQISFLKTESGSCSKNNGWRCFPTKALGVLQAASGQCCLHAGQAHVPLCTDFFTAAVK